MFKRVPVLSLLLFLVVSTVSAQTEKLASPAVATSANQALQVDTADPTAPVLLPITDLQRMLRRDSSPIRFFERTDGVTIFNLNGGFRSVLVMTIDPAGEHALSCVASEESAEAVLSPQSPDDQREP